MTKGKPERIDERFARLVLQRELGVQLEQYDTGQRRGDVSANGQFDYLALTEPLQPIEVIGDHEHSRPKQHSDLQKKGSTVDVPGLEHGWILYLSPTADVAELQAKLPAAFAELGDIEAARDRVRALSWQAIPAPLYTLGVRMMVALGADDLSVRLASGMVGHSSDDGDLGASVDAVLDRQPDAAHEVLRYDADRRHIVIVSMFGAAPNEWSAIRHGVSTALTAPHPPDGITDLWLIFAMQPSQGAHWNRTRWRLFALPGDLLDELR